MLLAVLNGLGCDLALRLAWKWLHHAMDPPVKQLL